MFCEANTSKFNNSHQFYHEYNANIHSYYYLLKKLCYETYSIITLIILRDINKFLNLYSQVGYVV